MEYDRSRSGSTRTTTVRWLPPNGGGAETPGQAREHRPDLEQRLVLDLADRLGLAREHEVADRDAAGVEPGDERRDGARRHERARAGDVADRLGHRLGHVGAGMEEQLHQGHALDVAALDVVDAGDVEEVVLVIVGEQPFHLRRVHAAVGLGDVDDRAGSGWGRCRSASGVTARTLPSATATTSTMTVSGRRMAKTIGFMRAMPCSGRSGRPRSIVSSCPWMRPDSGSS